MNETRGASVNWSSELELTIPTRFALVAVVAVACGRTSGHDGDLNHAVGGAAGNSSVNQTDEGGGGAGDECFRYWPARPCGFLGVEVVSRYKSGEDCDTLTFVESAEGGKHVERSYFDSAGNFLGAITEYELHGVCPVGFVPPEPCPVLGRDECIVCAPDPRAAGELNLPWCE